MMKTAGIAGGSGFVGRQLAQVLKAKGWEVVIFSRGKAGRKEDGITFAHWDPSQNTIDTAALAGIDTMINLAGAGVTDHRWTDAYKKEIISSRVDASIFLIDALKQHAPRCKTYITSSATGIYGPLPQNAKPFVEIDPPYQDFLGEVCRLWEAAAAQAQPHFRTVILRFGIVMGKGGGAYEEMTGPMKFGVMPVLGNGRQVVPWVHLDDLARIIVFAAEVDDVRGTYNCVAPNPVSNLKLMKAFSAAKGGVKIPVPVPAFGLKLLMGQSSIEVLKSCAASADKLLRTGFTFNYPTIEAAAKDLAG